MVSKLTTERVTERPSPEQWEDDELMTLAEAAKLHWPKGPITEETLRTAVRDGRLPVSEIARKLFTTKTALRVLSVCALRAAPSEPTVQGPRVRAADYGAALGGRQRRQGRASVQR